MFKLNSDLCAGTICICVSPSDKFIHIAFRILTPTYKRCYNFGAHLTRNKLSIRYRSLTRNAVQ